MRYAHAKPPSRFEFLLLGSPWSPPPIEHNFAQENFSGVKEHSIMQAALDGQCPA